MDRTDQRILDALLENSDRSRRDIARRVGISEPSVSKKIANLKSEGLIRGFTVNIDYDKVGFHTNAITFLRLRNQSRETAATVVQSFWKVNEAVEIYSTFGEWHLYVRWHCRSNAHLMDLLKNAMPPEVEHSQTVTFGEEHKREKSPRLLPPAEG